MLLTIAAIIVLLWILGLLIHVGGALIHLLLIAAIIIVIYDLIVGRRRV